MLKKEYENLSTEEKLDEGLVRLIEEREEGIMSGTTKTISWDELMDRVNASRKNKGTIQNPAS